jgi:hypothetical protein
LEAWDDGVAVTVGKPREFKPSEYVAAKKGEELLEVHSDCCQQVRKAA